MSGDAPNMPLDVMSSYIYFTIFSQTLWCLMCTGYDTVDRALRSMSNIYFCSIVYQICLV
jgi:hypothetical protein